MDVRIEEFSAIDVMRVRHVGPYQEVGPCFERLFEWAADAGVERVLTLSHDNPEVVSQERLRSDACIEVNTAVQPPEGIVRDSVGGGRCAVLTLRGPYDGIADGYRHLFGVWLPESGETVDDRPGMLIYRNSPADTPPSGLVTDLYLPLRPPSGAWPGRVGVPRRAIH